MLKNIVKYECVKKHVEKTTHVVTTHVTHVVLSYHHQEGTLNIIN